MVTGLKLMIALLNTCAIQRKKSARKAKTQAATMPFCPGAQQTSANIFLSNILLRRPENNMSLWNLPRTNDLWQDATTYWDCELSVTNTRMSRVTVTHITEEVCQRGA